MRKQWKTAIGVAALAFLFLLLLGFLELKEKESRQENETRIWHHELAAAADPTIGSDTIPEDFMVDETFVSHLPLVILDTGGKEIVNYKYYNLEEEAFVYQEGIDPYFDMQISVIDNDTHINCLADTPAVTSYGKIKVRGNTSSSWKFPKKQYLIKLLTEDGEKNDREIMGMSSSDTWILNGTQLDRSYLRNYIAMNTGGEISPYTPDLRFCEMVIKSGNRYEYMGLYGMYEKVEYGSGRVELYPASMEGEQAGGSYLLLRDRKDLTGKNMEVWSTANSRSNNWITLEYPSPEEITEDYWEMIQSDISEIEEVLYGEDRSQFYEYRTLLDVDSFVDYFIINEFFANYDAGWNSTFLYKDLNKKLAIGPFWDFDGFADNYSVENLDIRQLVLEEAPWFDRLVTDPYFVERMEMRYHELRKTILSDEVLKEKIEQTCIFLEKPAKRDWARWDHLYLYGMVDHEEEKTGLMVYRKKDTWQEEVQRFQDVLQEHGDYMDKNLSTKLMSYAEWDIIKIPDALSVLLAAVFITGFFASIVLVQRMRKKS